MSKITYATPTPYDFLVSISRREFVDLYKNCIASGQNVHILVSNKSPFVILSPNKAFGHYAEVYSIRQIYSYYVKLEKFKNHV